MHENPSIQAPLHFHKGLPSQEDIDNLYNGEFHIIVLDDLMEKLLKVQKCRSFLLNIVIIET